MIAVVTQGGVEEGLGHVMRMLWLMSELGERAVFLLNKRDDVVFRIIEDKGFEVTSGDYGELISRLKPEITIFDKFDVEPDLVKRAKDFGRVVLFDSTTANEMADIVINALVSGCGNCYHGLKYLILRRGFHEFWRKRKVIGDDVERVMLMFGGSDPSNFTMKVLKLVDEFETTVVVGPRYPYLNELRKRTDVIVNPTDVARLMFEHDVVITSLGLTMFEAMCVGTPVMAICQNDVQRWLLSHMPFLKFVLPRFNENEFRAVFNKLKSRVVRENMSRYGKSLCDGLGLFRVLDILRVII